MPIVICNAAGWAGPLVGAIDQAIAQGFADPGCRRLFEVIDSVEAVLDRLQTLQAGAQGEPELL